MLFSITDIFERKRKQLQQIKMTELCSENVVKLSQETDLFINLIQRKYPHQTFQILCRENNSTIHLNLSGHLDMYSIEQMDIFNSSFPYRFQGVTELEIDLSQLSFIDSAGANSLYQLILMTRENHIKVHIKEAQGTVYNLLDMLGFFELEKYI